MTDRAVDRAAEVLGRHAGLQFDTTSRDRLARALDDLAREHGTGTDELARELAPGTPVFAELRDRATLQETSWFRDPPWWDAVARTLLPAAAERARAAGRPVVLWSAGCAHGQEAYSLAIACEEAGISDYRVVATDLARPATERAAAGVYAERELRGLSDARRRRWLAPAPGGFAVDGRLRERVEVVHRNAAAAPPIADGACALVLCRYVLIYLAPGAVRDVLGHVERALEPEGHLMIGAAESLWHLSDRFELVTFPAAFAYRVRRDAPRVPARDRAPTGTRAAGTTGARAGAGPRDPGRPAVPRAAGGRARTADDGDAAPAALLARGEAALAAGDVAAAAAAFRGAAYLDPDDPIAHLQLGLALERAGDPGAQRAFRAAWGALRDADPGALRAVLGGYRAEELVHLVAAKLGGRP